MLNFRTTISASLFALWAMSAFAEMPITDLTYTTSNACPHACHNDSVTNMRNLYQQVNVISKADEHGKIVKDSRRALKDVPSKIASDETKERIRINTGYVLCSSLDPKVEGASGSGGLYGDGGQLTTALHVLYDKNGKLYDKCEFRNQQAHAQRVTLDLSTSGLLPFTTDPNVHYDKDLVGVRLKTPIIGAHPFRFDPTGRSLQEADHVILVAAHNDDQPKRFSLKEPIVDACTVQKTFAKTSTAPTAVYTDCSSEGGGSGGILFSITTSGEWVMAASAVGSGDSARDYQPYNYKGRSFTNAVGFDPEVVARLQTFQDNKRIQIGINPAPNPQPIE